MGSRETEAAFIICTNNERYLEECRFYIDKLQVPEGMTVKVIPIRHAKSMTAGYNEAMYASNAKYKIYLHQDMFIVNSRFLYDLIDLFRENDRLAMLGVAGTEHLQDADAWSSLDIGGCYSIGTFSGLGSVAVKPQIRNPLERYQAVDFIDGMLIATQYDMEWDERVEGFHFYDVSQCERYRRAGYEIGIVRQEELWSFHDFGPLNLATYRSNQRRFCELYGYRQGSDDDETQIYEMCDQIAAVLKDRFEAGDMEEVKRILDEVDNAIYFQQELLTARFFTEIHEIEEMTGRAQFMPSSHGIGAFRRLEDKWLELRLMLIRTIFGHETPGQIADMIAAGKYSVSAVQVAALHNIPEENMSILDDIEKCLGSSISDGRGLWDRSMSLVRKYERTRMPSAEGL
ncbi:MAG: glycosyltransferase family protein [Lachnospiraceae bacterium]|nr:glycosyltransferase family protein [Lachnospiraceae bacterium]